METKNATIESTMLGTEDCGVLSFWLHLNYGGSGQGFGGYTLDDVPAHKEEGSLRRPTAYGLGMIMEILRVLEVGSWEKLKGQHIRVRADHGKVHAIGHFLKDRWFDPGEYFEGLRADARPEGK